MVCQFSCYFQQVMFQFSLADFDLINLIINVFEFPWHFIT